MIVFDMIFTLAGVVFDWKDFFLPKANTADVLLKFNEFLQNGRTQAKTVIVMQ